MTLKLVYFQKQVGTGDDIISDAFENNVNAHTYLKASNEFCVNETKRFEKLSKTFSVVR